MSSRTVQISQNPILRVLPAALMMLAIFLFSAGSSMDMDGHRLERLINKGGHMFGYGILALTYWRIFEFRGNKGWIAWLLAVLYAMTDEIHQTFVPGRYGMIFDVLVYDNLGALLSVWLASLVFKQKQPATLSLVGDEDLLPANR